MHPQQRGKHHAYKDASEGQPKVLQPNRFMVRGKDVTRKKRGTGGLGSAGAVVVSDHFLYSSAVGGALNLSPYLIAKPQNCKAAEGKDSGGLIEVVAYFVEELMIAFRDACVSDLIGAIESQF